MKRIIDFINHIKASCFHVTDVVNILRLYKEIGHLFDQSATYHSGGGNYHIFWRHRETHRWLMFYNAEQCLALTERPYDTFNEMQRAWDGSSDDFQLQNEGEYPFMFKVKGDNYFEETSEYCKAIKGIKKRSQSSVWQNVYLPDYYYEAFQEWRDSKREILLYEIIDTNEVDKIFSYEGGGHIEEMKVKRGEAARYQLVIENGSTCSEDLAELEEELFKWAWNAYIHEDKLHEIAQAFMEEVRPHLNVSLDEFMSTQLLSKEQRDLGERILRAFEELAQ